MIERRTHSDLCRDGSPLLDRYGAGHLRMDEAYKLESAGFVEGEGKHLGCAPVQLHVDVKLINGEGVELGFRFECEGNDISYLEGELIGLKAVIPSDISID